VYFKATWPPQRYEAAVSSALARWRPADVGVVLDADERRGWLLLDDAGAKLRDILAQRRDLTHWKRVLPRYAELQLATARHVPELLGLGVPDRRSSVLADRYEQLLDERGPLRIGLLEGLSRANTLRLRGLVPRVREWCEELGGTIPDTIQHDDLHDGQVFLRDGAYELRRVLDTYLESFTHVATPKQIRQSYAIARRLGRISRALTWATVVRHLGARKRREERGDVPGWLALFLEVA